MLHLPQHPQQHPHTAKGHNNSTQVSTQLDRFFTAPSNKAQNSKKYSEGLACSTDEEGGLREAAVLSEEIEIYGQRMLVDYHCLDSIRSFLSQVQARKDLKQLTRESLKLLILQKAVNRKKQLGPLLHQSYERYERIVLKSIFN